MTPPAGRERLFAVWSRQPFPLRLDRLQSLVETAGSPGLTALRRHPRHEASSSGGSAAIARGLEYRGTGA